jgi:hypothetical protein
MNWNEIVDKQAAEYREFLEGYKQAREQLSADKAMLLKAANCTEAAASPELKDKFVRDEETFRQNWGMFSQQFKTMRINQQKEIDAFFKRQELEKDLATDKAKDKARGKDGGR